MKKKILNTFISTGSKTDIILSLLDLASNRTSSYVCIVNVHMLIEAYFDNNFNKLVNEADIATSDGMPIVQSIRKFYNIKQERIAGMDLMPILIKKSTEKNLKIFFYGSTDKVLNEIKDQLEKENRSQVNAGMYSPPFRPLTEEEDKKIINLINASKANFVFVALGCPKQEKWVGMHKNHISSCMIAFGGAFKVYTGEITRAPQWMQNNSLEWLYRLTQEPGRLFKRYFKTNLLFLYLIIVQFLKIKLFKQTD